MASTQEVMTKELSLLNQKSFKEAEKLYMSLILNGIENEYVFANLALCHFELGNNIECFIASNNALKIDPNFAGALNLRGVARQKMDNGCVLNNLNKAEADYVKASMLGYQMAANNVKQVAFKRAANITNLHYFSLTHGNDKVDLSNIFFESNFSLMI